MNVSLRSAVENFYAGQFGDLEHGITDEEAAQGLRDTFTSLGITWDEDCLFYCGSLTTAEEEAERGAQARKRADEYAIWAKANPEAAALQQSVENQLSLTRLALHERIYDDFFKSNPVFAALKHAES